MDLLRAIWRILAGISKVITVLVPLLFVVIFFAAPVSYTHLTLPTTPYV